ncbi:DUF6933 domain-containing protein [Vibrio tritonius]|uniref:DUF6933 domain-containing protein n=1 Tax=Vibrio tritonius TaxID=1435069 RepID=UPI000838EA45|nr:hypothetical protein [Vibrio tritonius]
MLIFNCTKAAADFFTVTRQGKKQSPIQKPTTESVFDEGDALHPQNQWVVHVKNILRKNALVVMHVPTRYAMVFSDIKKGDWQTFVPMVLERLFNNMSLVDEEFGFGTEDQLHLMLESFLHQHSDFQFHQRSDRSVTAHINDVFWHLENQAYDIGCLPNNEEEGASFDSWSNNQLRGTKQKKDSFFPEEEMFIDWMTQYGHVDTTRIAAIRDQFAAMRRMSFGRFDSEEIEDTPLNEQHIPDEIPDNVVDLFKFKAIRK